MERRKTAPSEREGTKTESFATSDEEFAQNDFYFEVFFSKLSFSSWGSPERPRDYLRQRIPDSDYGILLPYSSSECT